MGWIPNETRKLLELAYGAEVKTVRQPVTLNVNVSPTQIFKFNPARLFAELNFFRLGVLEIARSLQSFTVDASEHRAWDLLAPNQTWQTSWETDFDQVCEEVWAQSQTTTIEVYAIEYILSGLVTPD